MGGGGGGGAEDGGGGANARNRGEDGACGPSPLVGRRDEEDALGLSLKEIVVCLAFNAVGSCGCAARLGPAPFACACERRKMSMSLRCDSARRKGTYTTRAALLRPPNIDLLAFQRCWPRSRRCRRRTCWDASVAIHVRFSSSASPSLSVEETAGASGRRGSYSRG